MDKEDYEYIITELRAIAKDIEDDEITTKENILIAISNLRAKIRDDMKGDTTDGK